jgi:putative membrane protein
VTTERSGPEFDPRVGFAAERTLLAWIRTGLALMGFGFVVARFGLFLREIAVAEHAIAHNNTRMSFWVGTGLIVMGVIVIGSAALQHITIMRRFARQEIWQPKVSILGLALTAVLVCVGVILTGYLVISQP